MSELNNCDNKDWTKSLPLPNYLKPVSIKTWQEEAKEWPEYRRGLATNQMIWMQQEIDELRAALEQDTALSKQYLESWNSAKNLVGTMSDRIAELEEDLQFVERWANHHAAHPNISAKEALSVIQHYPSIEEVTKSYKDGVIPNTRNPYAEIEEMAKQIVELEKEDEISDKTIKLCSTILAKIAITLKGEPMELARHGYHDLPELVSVLHLENELNKVQMEEMLTAMRRAVLALAFAAESSKAMKDDYQALSNAIDKAVSAQKGTE